MCSLLLFSSLTYEGPTCRGVTYGQTEKPAAVEKSPEKSPRKPFVLLSLVTQKSRVCVKTVLYACLRRREAPKVWEKKNTSAVYLRTVSLVQHVSSGMLYPTSWPMLTSISSATLRARSTACCAWIWVQTTMPCWKWTDRQYSAHHWGICVKNMKISFLWR